MAIQTSDFETGNGYQMSDEVRSLLRLYPVTSRMFSIHLLESRMRYMDKRTRLRALKVINCLRTGRPYK